VHPIRSRVLLTTALLASALLPAALPAEPGGSEALQQAEQAEVVQWRAARLQELTGETGWLNLVGLLWLKDGENTFGRSRDNTLVLDNAALAAQAGTFIVQDHAVRFIARPGAGITHHGEPVTQIDMVPDSAGEPTVVSSGALRFFVIERAGQLGVRVRDLDSARLREFRGLDYFAVSAEWKVRAQFEPYTPARHVKIINILGMEDEVIVPGALVFVRDGQSWRLEAVLESPADTHLFIMFQDGTSGHETYGGGRFMQVPLPVGDVTELDFNKAFNPPCAVNDFATCPLPPPENRLKLRVDAGELGYRGNAAHPP
jgi:uncharacterized protein